METRLLVRVATVDDSVALEGLLEVLGYPGRQRRFAGRVARLRADASYESWVAIGNGLTVGFAAGHNLHPVECDRPAAQLIAPVTAPASRGSGTGSVLCDEFEQWARECGARRLLLNSGEHRVEAHGFYERRGNARTVIRFGKLLIDA
ncbi:GNAT family N-acetyltransferase [Janibacter limosus]|uniref:GNAT family N-acetyltransferase n=1 Tax=Janibacter limosus TaxID=53458 RepID=A0AC61U417_9MICO|nr:GNAT family N-acetyltransferase [Janibacter limosus]UUZ44728.1 GNAT family N-acetyltransferase [Janibacter limosus]